MSNNGYIGKIGHGGAQVIKAPVNAEKKTGKGNVKKGTDLRTGK